MGMSGLNKTLFTKKEVTANFYPLKYTFTGHSVYYWLESRLCEIICWFVDFCPIEMQITLEKLEKKIKGYDCIVPKDITTFVSNKKSYSNIVSEVLLSHRYSALQTLSKPALLPLVNELNKSLTRVHFIFIGSWFFLTFENYTVFKQRRDSGQGWLSSQRKIIRWER
jgi:hypothetical protein